MIVSREIKITDNSKLYIHNIYGTYLIFERKVIMSTNSKFYSLINCFSFSASMPAITNKINPGIPKNVATANTITP